MQRNIGIYPGSFDPIHEGHLAFAKESLKLCGLDEIIFLPEPQPREKTNVTPIQRRLNNILEAMSKEDRMSVVQLRTKQFSTDTALPELLNMFSNSDFTLMVGSDVLRTFTNRWPNLETLLSHVSLAIGMREGDTNEKIINIINDLQNTYNLVIRYEIIHTKHSHLTSTHVRQIKY